MENSIKYIRKTRALFLKVLEEMSLEQLNEIPAGFNNNVIWNFGHALISTLGLCYVRSGAAPEFKIPYGSLFGKGTRPDGMIPQETVDALKELAISSLDQLEADMATGMFDQITPYNTGTYGYMMSSIEEVLTCCLAHESLHLGIGKSQKAVLRKSLHYS
jgi:hypothetical protein